MPIDTQNAFQLLTFIAAPALLTNASSVLVLSTSNRFARAVDRTRTLAKTPEAPDRERALLRVARRTLMLNRALTSFYVAVASFAIGTFSELLGGGIAALVSRGEIAPIITEIGLFVATVGTFAIATGAAFLVAETWDAYHGLREEAHELLAGTIV
ncbi:MAG: DUF2721 domain-containing protein [Candidatus Eremiobacteraeota bacterium]|nr:DUF2721 domain-containing protein [Candidatus Eremiobacteraeota bacterium]MBV8643138.1 DUF2721 domain-containing protein [Candidatus Eremiobacteraeota bacterium]